MRSTVSSYDAYFVHVSRESGSVLVTLDERLVRAVPSVAMLPQDNLARRDE